jgi:hypothetical protein
MRQPFEFSTIGSICILTNRQMNLGTFDLKKVDRSDAIAIQPAGTSSHPELPL